MFTQKRTCETKCIKHTRVKYATLHHITPFHSFWPFGVRHCKSSCNASSRPSLPPFKGKSQQQKKKVLPRSAAGHSVCVTMVIFNNATSGQSQPQLSRALSQLQKPHTNEGFGKIGQERLRSVKTTPTTNDTHAATLTYSPTIILFHILL